MSKTVRDTVQVDVEVECDFPHADDPGTIDAIQRAYSKVAPENERACDWWRMLDKPWRSIADALGVR